ncbi:MAG TPA: U32 family peptidase [Thermomicrobiales bacterium]|nr:U32 family peptidase [Thermomicrobiales bacterium]
MPNGMADTRAFLRSMGLPEGDAHDLPSSTKRFPDGGQWRIEIPSVEGPNALQAVYDTADALDVPIHRVSQGSGVMLLTDDELDQMAKLGRSRNIEISLFVGPRAGWDTGAMATSSAGRVVAPKVRGMDQLVQAVEDVRRSCEHGINSVLVTDEGLLWVVGAMKKGGELPADLIIKGSVMIGAANPASIKLLEERGMTTFNVPTDLSLAQLAAIRAVVDMPLDLYIEVPDDIGGFIRHYEIAEIVRVCAPVYLKFGLRNAPNIYPSGTHLEATAISLTKERVRRAKLGLDLLHRLDPETVMSPLPCVGEQAGRRAGEQ